MIFRTMPDGWLVISQPAHAWASGQLAAAWGNENFAGPTPREAVIVATSLHDIGWQAWDTAPRLHPDGRPVNFLGTSLDETEQVWQRGVDHVRLLDPYAALLVSLHATTIYQRRMERGAGSLAEQARLKTRQTNHSAIQANLQAQLGNHAHYAPAATPTIIYANYRLLRTCDLLSLAICTGPLKEGEITEVPGKTPDEWITLRYIPSDDNTLVLTPYPFSEPQLTVRIEARRLGQLTFPNLSAFHTALAEATWTHLEFTLMPR